MVTERLLGIAEKTVQYATRQNIDQAQASAFLLDTALTRFANSQIHQNVATKKGGVLIKVVLNKQISTTRVNTLEEEQIEKAVMQAVRIARASPPNKDFKSLPEREPWSPIEGVFDEETANCTPRYRAEKVKEAIETAHSKSPIVKAVAGYFSTGSMAFAVANSLGVSARARLSSTNMKTTVISKSGTSEGFGTAKKYSRRVKDIQPIVLAGDAAEKSVKSINPIKLSLGEYEVVLSPLASATLLMFLGYVGFSATSYQDGRSFVEYCLNQQVFDGKLNVKDDAKDPRTLYATPIDGEGVPKRTVQLISNGVVSEQSICYNSFTAGREGKKSTGHALPPISDYYSERPMPFNMIANPGDATLEEMIAETKRGIFVTTFHYVNPVEPTKVVLTGLTRDGTFLIENGEMSKPIVNMRFTDSMLSALKNILMIGKKLEMVEATTVPSMKLQKLKFVGISAY
ncbi:MAG: TldD/PmbA family protein [Candidatus Bathyarchaeota archaeon]|nr:TldD/PmbA family protein [Candidatus Bathyarchaeota archaeon]